jgi:hypothetical protein
VNFLNHLETTRGNSPASRNIRLAAIKSFMHYMEFRVPSALEQIQRVLAIPAKKTDIHLVKHLTHRKCNLSWTPLTPLSATAYVTEPCCIFASPVGSGSLN